MEPDALITPEWAVAPRVRAAMTLRMGGVSAAPYDTLNLALHVGDDPVTVAANRRHLREVLALPSEPAWLEQVHGASVVDLDAAATLPVESSAVGTPSVQRGDAAVTRQAGRVCAIQVADCMPVLMAARDGSVVAAAHAGWRGLAGGVLEATVRATRAQPAQLLAWLGPAIGPAHFEVGDEVRAAFVREQTQASSAFVRNARGRWQCDLYALARLRLAALGIEDVSGGGYCTFSDSRRFFSYRRDGRCGRMAALIWLA